MKMISQDKPRSNTAIAICGWVSMFALCFVGYRIQHSQPHLASLIGLGSFSLVFVAAGLAQLRSGYLLSNLTPGNRGAHRSKVPYRFMASTILHFALAFAIVGFALWRYWHGGDGVMMVGLR